MVFGSHDSRSGFTIVELVVTIVVIGILVGMTTFGFYGIQTRVIEEGLEADIMRIESLQAAYKYDHDAPGLAYYSVTDIDNEFNFKTKNGNIIDVVIDDSDYCIRAYNTRSTHNSLDLSITKESSVGACEKDTLEPSIQAQSDASGTEYWTDVAAGSYHACGITTQKKIYCWGTNSSGQLGDGTNVQKTTPTLVSDSLISSKTVKAVSASNLTTCVIASDGDIDSAFCWGSGNSVGQLGNQTDGDSYSPVAVYNADPNGLGGKTIRQISVGGTHVCVLASNSKVYCWGNNDYGQLGIDMATVKSNVPVKAATIGLLNGVPIKYVSAGDKHTCVVSTDNNAYCWGKNNNGQLGNDTTSTTGSYTPYQVVSGEIPPGVTAKTIEAGYYHTCLIASDNHPYCWGYGGDGEMGDNDGFTSKDSPVSTEPSGMLASVMESGYYHTCIINSLNREYCWGHNYKGKLGDGTTTNSSLPLQVAKPVELANEYPIKISGGLHFSCSVYSNGEIYCRGYNSSGQFGNDTTDTDDHTSLVKTNLPPQ